MESGRYVIPRQQVEGKLEQYQNCSPFQCLQLAMETMQETYRKNRPEKFERAAQLLLQSEHIFISGFRGFSGSAPVHQPRHLLLRCGHPLRGGSH